MRFFVCPNSLPLEKKCKEIEFIIKCLLNATKCYYEICHLLSKLLWFFDEIEQLKYNGNNWNIMKCHYHHSWSVTLISSKILLRIISKHWPIVTCRDSFHQCGTAADSCSWNRCMLFYVGRNLLLFFSQIKLKQIQNDTKCNEMTTQALK